MCQKSGSLTSFQRHCPRTVRRSIGTMGSKWNFRRPNPIPAPRYGSKHGVPGNRRISTNLDARANFQEYF